MSHVDALNLGKIIAVMQRSPRNVASRKSLLKGLRYFNEITPVIAGLSLKSAFLAGFRNQREAQRSA